MQVRNSQYARRWEQVRNRAHLTKQRKVAGPSVYPIYSGFAPFDFEWIAKLRSIDPVASISEETASKFQT